VFNEETGLGIPTIFAHTTDQDLHTLARLRVERIRRGEGDLAAGGNLSLNGSEDPTRLRVA